MRNTEMVTIPVCIRNNEFNSPRTMNLPLLLQDALKSQCTKKPCSFTPVRTFLGSPSCSLAEDITGLTMALSMQLLCLCLAVTHKRKPFQKKCWPWTGLKDWCFLFLFPGAPPSLKKSFPLHHEYRRQELPVDGAVRTVFLGELFPSAHKNWAFKGTLISDS